MKKWYVALSIVIVSCTYSIKHGFPISRLPVLTDKQLKALKKQQKKQAQVQAKVAKKQLKQQAKVQKLAVRAISSKQAIQEADVATATVLMRCAVCLQERKLPEVPADRLRSAREKICPDCLLHKRYANGPVPWGGYKSKA